MKITKGTCCPIIFLTQTKLGGEKKVRSYDHNSTINLLMLHDDAGIKQMHRTLSR